MPSSNPEVTKTEISKIEITFNASNPANLKIETKSNDYSGEVEDDSTDPDNYNFIIKLTHAENSYFATEISSGDITILVNPDTFACEYFTHKIDEDGNLLLYVMVVEYI